MNTKDTPNVSGFYKDILDQLYDGVYLVDRNRIITYWNKGAERITGYTKQDVVGLSCRDNLLTHINEDGTLLCNDQCPLAACMEDGIPREAHVFLHHARGHRVPVMVRAAPVLNKQNKIIGSAETFSIDTSDSTVRQELHNLRQRVHTDQLTGVSSREYLEGRLHATAAELAYQTGINAGLLFIDIDYFKAVNDQYGHDIGDQALQMVATTLKYNVRKSDLVGRWGGEEFLVLLYDVANQDEISPIAEKLKKLIETSRLDIENHSIALTVSIGATLFRPDDTPKTVVRRADQLMYQSKNAGRNRVSVG